MSTLTAKKTLARHLVLISAAILLHANGVFAAQPMGDAQQQARDLLTGTVDGHARTVDKSPVVAADSHRRSKLDPQEQARQLILGTSNLGGIADESATFASTTKEARAESERGRVHADPQESARRMILGLGASEGATPALKSSVSLTQPPLVMRLNKDEFRIAFGINAERCGANGCSGAISYRVDWRTEDGKIRSDHKRVNYTAPPGAGRTIAVDHQYFDTAEAEHTTEIVKVSLDKISRLDTRPTEPGPSAAQAPTGQSTQHASTRTF